MWIRSATVEDLPNMMDWALEFAASSPNIRPFNMERWAAYWAATIEAGVGVIFLLLDGDVIVGALCGAAYPDISSFGLTASEFAWFLREKWRGGSGALKLYRLFEAWAREKGCEDIQMSHLSDVMPEKVADFYLRNGYVKAETRYVKRLEAA